MSLKDNDTTKGLASGEIIRPRDFYDLFAMLKIPTVEHDWWVIRWGMIVGFTLLAVLLTMLISPAHCHISSYVH